MSDIKESFLNKVDELREERMNEMNKDGILKRYREKAIHKIHYHKEPIEKREKGLEMSARKLWGGYKGAEHPNLPKAKVPAKD